MPCHVGLKAEDARRRISDGYASATSPPRRTRPAAAPADGATASLVSSRCGPDRVGFYDSEFVHHVPGFYPPRHMPYRRAARRVRTAAIRKARERTSRHGETTNPNHTPRGPARSNFTIRPGPKRDPSPDARPSTDRSLDARASLVLPSFTLGGAPSDPAMAPPEPRSPQSQPSISIPVLLLIAKLRQRIIEVLGLSEQRLVRDG